MGSSINADLLKAKLLASEPQVQLPAKLAFFKFICSCCGDEFDISEIKKGTLTSIGTGKSKKCHNESQRLYQTLKLANKKPHKYKQCDDCDGVFAICNRNKFLNHCRFCKSTNIEQYHP